MTLNDISDLEIFELWRMHAEMITISIETIDDLKKNPKTSSNHGGTVAWSLYAYAFMMRIIFFFPDYGSWAVLMTIKYSMCADGAVA